MAGKKDGTLWHTSKALKAIKNRGAFRGRHGHTRAQTSAGGLFCAGLRHHGGSRLARADGRLAGSRGAARGHAGIPAGWITAAARWLRVRRMGKAASGRGRRSGLHGAGFSFHCERLRRVDDAAGVLYRMSLGSGGAREARGLCFSITQFGGVVSRGGATGFSAAMDTGSSANLISRSAKLSRDSPEREFSELDNRNGAGGFCCVAGSQRSSREIGKLRAAVLRRPICFDLANAADCAVLPDRIRIGDESGGGIPYGISLGGILSRDRDGPSC